MPLRNFMALLHARQDAGFNVCVGLDSDPKNKKFPEHLKGGDLEAALVNFNKAIINKTADLVCCYKINIAFYLQLGEAGIRALKATVAYINEQHPDIPVIIDHKCGDIENTNNGYVNFVFETLCGDAVTVPPYMGRVSLMPFLERKDNGIFILVRTSNKGADEFQNLSVQYTLEQHELDDDGIRHMPLYQYVATKIAKSWNENGNCGVVVGATAPEDELLQVREIIGPEIDILIPGVGAQGGDLEKSIAAASHGKTRRLLVNLSRSVIFASSGEDFADAARKELEHNHSTIQQALESAGVS